eukprot:6458661-Amphidinium_carterae.1
MEPSSEEMSSWSSVSDVLKWAGFADDPGEEGTVSNSFLQLLGAHPAQHWRPLAMMPEDHLQSLIDQWQGTGEQAAWRPSPFECSQAALVGFAARCAAGKHK